jgi:ribosomal protein S18 acetylase RimI-like enzyme
MAVRRATSADAVCLIDFNARMALETENLTLDRATLEAGVRAILEDSAKGFYFVAEIDGRVVGQLMITFEWSDWRNGNIWWIQSVYVLPEYRRRGVFRAMFEHVEHEARGAGVVGLRLYVEQHNAAAQGTYQRLGMSLSHYQLMEKMGKSF